MERETIYSTMQFNSLNSQMKLYLSVLTLSGELELFLWNVVVLFSKFLGGNMFSVHALSLQAITTTTTTTTTTTKINQDALKL